MTEPEWILVTVRDSGCRKPVRPAAIMSYGVLRFGVTYIDYDGKTIEVSESVRAIAELVGSPYVDEIIRRAERDSPRSDLVLPKDIPFRRV